jgi:hypothetical protein
MTLTAEYCAWAGAARINAKARQSKNRIEAT